MPTLKRHQLNGHDKYSASRDGENRLSGYDYKRGQEGGLATDPDLIGRIQRDIEALGVVGEENNRLLIYLTGSSRKLKHPLRSIIRGPSSGGKTYPLMQVASMMPPDEVVLATSLTPQALYYLPPGALEHKFVVKGERSHRTDEEGADATAALRQLISEDRIVKQVTIKMETVTIEQKGPIAFCETTTCKSIFAEDLNRCFQVWVDDSPEQTKRILQASAAAYLNPEQPDTSKILDQHHEFQRSLASAEVVIPYAGQLADYLPSEKLEARRIFKQLLAAIETVTFLHQHQRQRDKGKRLVATAADYAIARRLLLPSLNESVGFGAGLTKAYEQLRQKFPGRFTTSDTVSERMFTNKMTAATTLKKLVVHEVLKCVVASNGNKPATWGWTGRELRPVLPPSVTA